MELTVIRKYFKEYTIGKMYTDGNYFCNTLEDKVRELNDINHDGDFDDPGEGKVYGETAIPCGRYHVIVTNSPKLKRRLPLLVGVPGFTGIRIHKGTDQRHTEGCILVGENKIVGGLINGAYYETVLRDLIDSDVAVGKMTFITIKQ